MTPIDAESDVTISYWRPWTAEVDQVSGPCLVRGEGQYLWAADGTRYLDLMSGALNTILGHADPRLTAALQHQASSLTSCDLMASVHGELEQASRAIIDRTPLGGGRVFMTNSGSEAIEASLRLAAERPHVPDSPVAVVTINGGYHGSTSASLGVSSVKLAGLPWQVPVRPVPLDVTHPDGSALTVDEILTGFEEGVALARREGFTVAAVVVEPFLNVGGFIPVEPGALAALRAEARRQGMTFIADEIFSGTFRCGPFALSGEMDDPPDIVVVSKGLTNGTIPLAAAVVSSEIVENVSKDGALGGFRYGHTTSGNPLACAAVIATLQRLDEMDAGALSVEVGRRFQDALRPLVDGGKVLRARSSGAAIAVDIDPSVLSVESASTALESLGVIARWHETRMVLAPPLCVQDDDISFFTDALASALDGAA